MRNNILLKKIICATLSAAMVITSSGIYSLSTTVKTAYAFSAGSSIDEETYLTEKEIKDTTLCQVLRVIANYTNARIDNPSLTPLTGEENLLSDKYNEYKSGAFTFGDLKKYTGPINLSPYADNIYSIEGLGYARGASSIDISQCSNITSIPADEFGKCKMNTFIMSADVATIGDRAFQQCTDLSDIRVAGNQYEKGQSYTDLSNVTKIGNYAFDGCSKLTNISLYEGDQDTSQEVIIGTSAFNNCLSIYRINIPIKNAANLGEGAFAGCKGLIEITLMDQLDYIPANVFSNTSITNVKLYSKEYNNVNIFPSALTYIGRNAFQDAKLGTMDFSKSKKIEYIGEYGFAGANIRSLTLPDGLKRIDSLAFNATQMSKLEIPDSVTTIKSQAFQKCHIATITVSSNVEEIENSTFAGSPILKNVIFKSSKSDPGRLKVIGEAAFKNCTALTGIELADSTKSAAPNLTSIEDEAFYGCSSLADTNFLLKAVNLTSLGKKAFAECCIHNEERDYENRMDKTIYNEWRYYGLTDVTLPNSVTTIGEQVFANNYALKTVNLGSSVNEIPNGAFKVTDANPSVLQKIIVSKALTSIGDEAFKYNSRLRTIGYTDGANITVTPGTALFPDSLTHIGDNAFNGCGGRHEISFRYGKASSIRGVTYTFNSENVYSEPAAGCNEYIIYEPGDTGYHTAYLNLSEAVEKPKNEGEASGTRTVYIIAEKVWVNPSNASDDMVDIEVLEFADKNYGYSNEIIEISKVPVSRESLSDSKVNGWNEKYILFYDSIYHQLSAQAASLQVAVYTGLSNVILPRSLEDTESNQALGTGVFEGCKALEKVAMSTKVTELPDRTFYGCGNTVIDWTNRKAINNIYTGLTSVTGLDRITRIGNSCFYECYNYDLEQSHDGGEISNDLRTIGNNAFYNCKSLSSIVFHSALISIGDNAFKYCGAMDDEETFSYVNNNNEDKYCKYFKILDPDNANNKGLRSIDFTYATKLANIGSEAFAYTAVETVNLPEAAFNIIHDGLFAGCSRLKTVTIPSQVGLIGANAFKDCHSLTRLHMPASAVIDPTILRGYTPSTISGLVLNYDTSSTITVPLNTDEALPINALTEGTRTGSYKITVYENEDDTIGTVIYDNGANIDGDYYDDVLNVRIIYGNAKNTDTIYLSGGSVSKKGLTVKVEANTAFSVLNGDSGSIINSQAFIYNVDITAVPATMLTLSGGTGSNSIITEKDATGNETNNIYLKKDQKVTLTADILPSKTTDECIWSIENEAIAELSDKSYADGKGTINLTALKPGNTKVTVQCGAIKKELYVFVKIPVTSITATTNSTQSSSSGSEFELPVSGEDQIKISMDYNKDSYTEDEWSNYSDTIIFSSSDPDIATVDSNGRIIAHKVGVVEITATAAASGKTITYKISVVPEKDYSTLIGKKITAIEGGDSVYTNTSTQLTAILDPVKATNKVKWAVNGSSTISDTGVLKTGDVPETIQVTATMLDAEDNPTSATYTVNIKVLQAATEIKFTKAAENISVYEGETVSLSKTSGDTGIGYSLVPETSTDTVDCVSADTDVATCTSDGTSIKINGIKQGTTTITVKSSSGISVQLPIKVVTLITSISLEEKCSIEAGQTKQLTPVINPVGSLESYIWSSSNTSVATIDENGLVTAIKPGTANINVKTAKGQSASCSITVTQKAASIELTAAASGVIEMYVGESFSLNKNAGSTSKGYKLLPDNSTDSVTCVSSNETIVTCTAKGTTFDIKAVGQGLANLVLTADSGVTSTVQISVKAPITNITLPSEGTVQKGKTIKLTPVITPAESTETLTWESSDTSVATVDSNGVVTGKGKGTAKITVKTEKGKSATCSVKVTIPATKLVHKTYTNSKTIYVVKGDSFSIGCALTPSDSTDTIKYTSNKKKIASVSGSGQNASVKALKKGTAKITAKSSSGAKVVFTVKVCKKSVAAKKVKITGKKTVKVGQKLQLTAKLTKASSTDKISWSSSNSGTASVDSYGTVTGVKKGKCKITATASSGKSATIKINVKK